MQTCTKEKLIKSKERAKKYAEVYTPSWMVKKMCDMLRDEGWAFTDIRQTILDLCCGNGNFLVEILDRYLKLCNNIDDGLVALQSIFGVDILPDNVQESKDRMYEIFVDKFGPSMFAIEILNKNIVCGDMLKMRHLDGTPIWFLEEYLEECENQDWYIKRYKTKKRKK